MSWLRSLFAQGETITRLERERDFHSARAAELQNKFEASEARLRAETHRNRRREDALVGQIVELAGGKGRSIPERTEPKAAADTEEPGDDAKAFDPDFEANLKDVVDQLSEQSPFEYGPDDLALLEGRIRQSPNEYGL